MSLYFGKESWLHPETAEGDVGRCPSDTQDLKRSQCLSLISSFSLTFQLVFPPIIKGSCFLFLRVSEKKQLLIYDLTFDTITLRAL